MTKKPHFETIESPQGIVSLTGWSDAYEFPSEYLLAVEAGAPIRRVDDNMGVPTWYVPVWFLVAMLDKMDDLNVAATYELKAFELTSNDRFTWRRIADWLTQVVRDDKLKLIVLCDNLMHGLNGDLAKAAMRASIREVLGDKSPGSCTHPRNEVPQARSPA